MKNTIPVRPSLRFRRWSRKAYAAFASIGRCVTIGCLRKNVADSSLSKQKVAGAARHTACSEASAWQGITQGRDTDIGIPLGTALINSITGVDANLQVLVHTLHMRPCTHKDVQEVSLFNTGNHTGTNYRRKVRHNSQHTTSSIIRASFLK